MTSLDVFFNSNKSSIFYLALNPSLANFKALFLSCVTDFSFFFMEYLFILFSFSWIFFNFSSIILLWVVFAKASNMNSLGLDFANFFFWTIHWCSPLQKLYSQYFLIGLRLLMQTIIILSKISRNINFKCRLNRMYFLW